MEHDALALGQVLGGRLKISGLLSLVLQLVALQSDLLLGLSLTSNQLTHIHISHSNARVHDEYIRECNESRNESRNGGRESYGYSRLLGLFRVVG